MIYKKDFNFYLNSILNFSVIQKYGHFSNFYQVPKFEKVLISFSSIKIEDFNNPSFFNYPYFIKFFLGVNAFFLAPKAHFHLGVTTYSVKVISFIKRKELFLFLNFFYNDLLPIQDEFSHFFSKKSSLYSYTLGDLSLFSEKKTNVGLFNLSSPLNFKLIINGVDNSSLLLLKGLKIKLN